MSDVQYKMLARITLALVDTIPCIGGATVTLLDLPHVDFKLRLMVRPPRARWSNGPLCCSPTRVNLSPTHPTPRRCSHPSGRYRHDVTAGHQGRRPRGGPREQRALAKPRRPCPCVPPPLLLLKAGLPLVLLPAGPRVHTHTHTQYMRAHIWRETHALTC